MPERFLGRGQSALRLDDAVVDVPDLVDRRLFLLPELLARRLGGDGVQPHVQADLVLLEERELERPEPEGREAPRRADLRVFRRDGAGSGEVAEGAFLELEVDAGQKA